MSALCVRSDSLDSAAVASAWLNALPLTADAVEAVAQHDLLVRLLTARDPRILGPVSVGYDITSYVAGWR